MSERPVENDTPCAEEARLLRALWDFIWNEKGDADYGDHVGVTWAEAQKESDLAAVVEDHHVAHGCRPLPSGSPPD